VGLNSVINNLFGEKMKKLILSLILCLSTSLSCFAQLMVTGETNYLTNVSATMTNRVPVPPSGSLGIFCYIINRGTNDILVGSENGGAVTLLKAEGGGISLENFIYNNPIIIVGTTTSSNQVSVWRGWGKNFK